MCPSSAWTCGRPVSALAGIPTFANEAADYSNRGSIFNVSGGGYFFGFTFGDKIKSTDSHHLLDCFQFAGKAKLDEFYSKVVKAFGSVAASTRRSVTRPQESQIVGPVPATGTQTQATDTTAGSSPYIYNTSIGLTWDCAAFLLMVVQKLPASSQW